MTSFLPSTGQLSLIVCSPSQDLKLIQLSTSKTIYITRCDPYILGMATIGHRKLNSLLNISEQHMYQAMNAMQVWYK